MPESFPEIDSVFRNLKVAVFVVSHLAAFKFTLPSSFALKLLSEFRVAIVQIPLSLVLTFKLLSSFKDWSHF